MKLRKRLIAYFSQPKRLAILNATIILIAIIGNTFMQVFCIPSKWAMIVLIVCFLNTVLFPLTIKKEKLIPIISFINGISFCLFIYCIIFLAHMNYIGIVAILFFGLGLLVYIPHFFAIQILWKGFIKLTSKTGRLSFLFGIMISISLLLFSGMLYKQALVDIENFKNSDYQNLNKTFMTEKILGSGIIYHTRFSEFDGWRPPIHEPILIMGMWLYENDDFYKRPFWGTQPKRRVFFYRKFFPKNKIKFDCSCAIRYSQSYHNDLIWN